MRFWVEGHRSRPALGLQGLKDCQFAWVFFSRDYRSAISARGERELRCAIERTAIDAGANRNSADDLSAFSIEHNHHFVMATRKQTMMLGIQSNSAWSFARRKRPVRDDFVLVHIDYRDLTLVFNVAVNAPRCFIYDREFWISSERNRDRDGSRFRIYNGDRISSVIENVDLTMARLINNGVWIWTGI